MAEIQELMEARREEEWRRTGVLECDLAFSRLSGIGAPDVRTFREFSLRGLLIVVRCPKLAARPWHGLLPPKPMVISKKTWEAEEVYKTWETGVVYVDKERKMFVSDYDLMSIWRRGNSGFEKVIVASTTTELRGPLPKEATAILRELNKQLVSRVQHCGQDDGTPVDHPGVKPTDHFAAFNCGFSQHMGNFNECALYYAKYGLTWPYDAMGNYTGPATS